MLQANQLRVDLRTHRGTATAVRGVDFALERGDTLGLIGESIPLLARILKVADVYDALVSDRPYRAAWTADEATTYLLQHSGTAFDPRLIQIFAYRVLPRQQHPGFPLD